MKLTCMQIVDAYTTIKELAEQKMPFKLSILVSRNLTNLQKEYDFYMEQERKFVIEYLVIDQETGQLQQTQPGVFTIQEGKQEDCVKARQELDNFEVDIEIYKLPVSLLENLEFTPAQLMGISFMIDEGEE